MYYFSSEMALTHVFFTDVKYFFLSKLNYLDGYSWSYYSDYHFLDFSNRTILNCKILYTACLYKKYSTLLLDLNSPIDQKLGCSLKFFFPLQWTSLQILCSSNCASFRVPSLPGHYLPGSKARKSTYRQSRLFKSKSPVTLFHSFQFD